MKTPITAGLSISYLPTGLDNKELSPMLTASFKRAICQTTNLLYIAASICLAYLILGWSVVFMHNGPDAAEDFVVYFVTEYQGFLTGIPILTLYLISERLLRIVPVTISKSISYKELLRTRYKSCRKSYSSQIKAVAQSSCYFVSSYAVFSILEFDRPATETFFLKLYSSAEVYCVCYVARKLYHIGRMLESIRNVDVSEDLFSDDKLSRIVVTVNIFTFAMIVSLIIHTVAHYNLSYKSDIVDPEALRILVTIPVLLILPVLVLFNFQPRSVVNSLYLASINKKKARLSSMIEQSDLTDVEKSKRLMDYDKILKDELRYHYRLAFTEAPIVLTIMLGTLTLLLKLID